MKDVKIIIAKSIFIFVVFVVVAVATIAGLWPALDIFYFCCGCTLAFFVAAIKARQFARSVMLGVLWGVYAMVIYQGWLAISDAGSRLSILVMVPASVCFGAVLVCWKQFPKREAVQKVIVVFAVMMGVLAGGFAALSVLPYFRTRYTVEQTANSPDGRYQAVRIDRENMGYDTEIITIRPTYFSVFHILDYPNIELTEMSAAASFNVHWASQRTLVVECSEDFILYDPVESWRDVKIAYHIERKSSKEWRSATIIR